MTGPRPTVIEGIHTLPLPTPFPIGRVNVYLVCGSPLTLIDSGVNSERSYDELVAGLRTLGYRVADIERIIISHHHVDHMGAVARLVADSGAEVWSHESGVPYLEEPEAARRRLHNWSLDAWAEGGAPSDLLDLTGQIFSWFDSLSSQQCQPCGFA